MGNNSQLLQGGARWAGAGCGSAPSLVQNCSALLEMLLQSLQRSFELFLSVCLESLRAGSLITEQGGKVTAKKLQNRQICKP